MTIPVGAYQVTSTNPNPFDTFYFGFQMPYTYQGGDLVILFSHDGSSSSTFAYHDVVVSNAATYGKGQYAATYNATTATTQSSFVITRIHFGYGPAGCMGANGMLNLILSNNLVAPTPAPGKINLAVTNGQANAVGGILISPTPGLKPVPLPGGCNLLIFPVFIGHIPIALDSGGRFDLNLTFPAAILGVELQAYASDSTASAGFVVTNAVSFKIG